MIRWKNADEIHCRGSGCKRDLSADRGWEECVFPAQSLEANTMGQREDGLEFIQKL